MYEQYWKMQRPAFRALQPGDGFFPAHSHQSALLKFRFLIDHEQPAAALIGEPGVGKTFVLDRFLSDLAPANSPVIRLLFPLLTPSELVSYLARRLGGSEPFPAAPDLWLDHWEAQLARLQQEGRRPIVIIDDAQAIDDPLVWQTLHLLLNYRHGDRPAFTLVLCGQPELAGRLEHWPALCERFAFLCGLTAFTEEETAGYVRQRLERSGAATDLFQEAALARIHELSGGLPRRINRLCDFALLVGYADQLQQIATAQVDAVAEELQLAA